MKPNRAILGRRLTIAEALALCYKVGFRGGQLGKPLNVAVSVMTAESGRSIESYGVNENKSIDRGLFQVNTIHVNSIGMADSFRAVPNARFAFVLSAEGENWAPWNAFKSGAHEEFMDEIFQVWKKDDRAWRDLLETIVADLGGE